LVVGVNKWLCICEGLEVKLLVQFSRYNVSFVHKQVYSVNIRHYRANNYSLKHVRCVAFTMVLYPNRDIGDEKAGDSFAAMKEWISDGAFSDVGETDNLTHSTVPTIEKSLRLLLAMLRPCIA